jgi:hypothetical protein
MQMTHADLERLLDKDGKELLRQLLQDHLDLRGPGEACVPVVSSGGIEMPHARLRERRLKSLFGTVTPSRLGYSGHGEESLFPRDAELNLPPEVYSHGVQRKAAEEVTKASFEQAVAAIASNTGTTVPKRQMEKLAARAATDFDGFYQTRAADSVREAAKAGPILALSTDGKGIVMRTESLREATRKAAAKREHKMSKRLSRGEKRNCKRMAQVATVFTIGAFVRKPEDIVTDLRPVRDADAAAARPRPGTSGSGPAWPSRPRKSSRPCSRKRFAATPPATSAGWRWSTAIRPNWRSSKRRPSGMASSRPSCST